MDAVIQGELSEEVLMAMLEHASPLARQLMADKIAESAMLCITKRNAKSMVSGHVRKVASDFMKKKENKSKLDDALREALNNVIADRDEMAEIVKATFSKVDRGTEFVAMVKNISRDRMREALVPVVEGMVDAMLADDIEEHCRSIIRKENDVGGSIRNEFLKILEAARLLRKEKYAGKAIKEGK